MRDETRHPLELAQANENEPGPWWTKCQEPERPGDQWTIYIWDCDVCMIGMVADARRDPAAYCDQYDSLTGEFASNIDLPTSLEEANKWRLSQGLYPIGN